MRLVLLVLLTSAAFARSQEEDSDDEESTSTLSVCPMRVSVGDFPSAKLNGGYTQEISSFSDTDRVYYKHDTDSIWCIWWFKPKRHWWIGNCQGRGGDNGYAYLEPDKLCPSHGVAGEWRSADTDDVLSSGAVRGVAVLLGLSPPPPKKTPEKDSSSKKVCTTVSGAAPNLPCIFPFRFNGQVYNKCTWVQAHLTKHKPWCSTLVDETGHHVGGAGKWGNCGPDCPIPPDDRNKTLEGLGGGGVLLLLWINMKVGGTNN